MPGLALVGYWAPPRVTGPAEGDPTGDLTRLTRVTSVVVMRSIGSGLPMDYTAVCQTTHLAARMEPLAEPGSTLVTADTLHLAEGFVQGRPLGPMAVKALGEPVEAFELTGTGAVRSRLQAVAARGLSRFVGRNAEIEALRRALEQARQGRGQVAAVVGEPGIGMRPLVAQGHLTLGRLYGRASRLQQAREHLGLARSMLGEMGMTLWLEQAEAELKELGG
ncbi:MAG: hypothetical protein A2X50_08645 [Candidatus Rokubacteria bacterium GWF2_70_14]|nr:MAG: hypothetical protein A2X53_09480 [Candidatus Rokubacteria bacterium GWA2_70_23]OGK89629.1 MAG: hypothetical protein A2X50_08645 [Candidatus Rokubacteria bacterium GWF2_70_14]